MKEIHDLFGRLCWQYFNNHQSSELKLQLDNGVVMDDFPVSFYVDTNELRELEKEFLENAKGRVLDLGCGPGRVSLILKKRGLEVIGVDISEGMVHISQKRDINAYKMDINKELPVGVFDTIIMYGNGFGMPGSIENIKNLLRRLHSITSTDALIIAESNDPNRMTNQIDLEYQERNRELERYIGQRKWRTVSGDNNGTWEYWIQVEPKLLKQIVNETGWKITKGPNYEPTSQWGAYFFMLSKDESKK